MELDPAVYYPGSTLSTDQRRIYNGSPVGSAPTGSTLYGSIGQGTQDVISNYNSLQLTAQRRMKQLTLLANYTYSKALDDVPNGQGNAGISAQSLSTLPSTNPLRHQVDYGRSDFDHRHIAVISYVYDLPSFSNQNRLTRELAGGWQLTGIIRRQSGQALTTTAGADRSQTGLNTDRAMKTASNVYGGTACAKVATACVNYLNPASFVTVYTNTSFPLGTYGNTGKGAFNGPAFIGWDVGALKNFALSPSDRFRLQFHAEFFNVLNHTNLNNPTTAANSANFGNIQSSQDPRIGQLALKLLF